MFIQFLLIVLLLVLRDKRRGRQQEWRADGMGRGASGCHTKRLYLTTCIIRSMNTGTETRWAFDECALKRSFPQRAAHALRVMATRSTKPIPCQRCAVYACRGSTQSCRSKQLIHIFRIPLGPRRTFSCRGREGRAQRNDVPRFVAGSAHDFTTPIPCFLAAAACSITKRGILILQDCAR